MSEPFVAQIIMAGFNFNPRGWASCNGQIMSIQQNTALFSLLGTTYGGNGQVTFALPDMRGRAPMQQGNGPEYQATLGEASGEENTTLIQGNIPSHAHNVVGPPSQECGTGAGTSNGAGGRYPAVTSRPLYADTPTGNLGGNSFSGVTGNGLPHNNMQPYLTVNFIIALNGIFPSRN